MTPTEPVGGYVLYGTVVDYVESTFASGSAFGIEVVPSYTFRVPKRTPDGRFEIFPMGLAPDCRPVPLGLTDIEERFELGSVVGVVGAVPDLASTLGNIDFHRTGILFRVEPGCNLDALERREHDCRELGVPCGHYRFEANKDIARLDAVSQTERVSILERLAAYRGLIAYSDLVGKYLPEAAGRRLMKLRYGDVMALGCLAPEAALESFDWERRLRWGEYCTQADPYDPTAREATELYTAIASGRTAFVENFIARGGNPNAPLRGTPMGWVYPLNVAVRADSEPIALALLDAGADFERSGLDSYVISAAGMAQVWEFLLSQREDRLQSARETIDAACSHGYFEVVEVLSRHALERNTAPATADALASCVMMSPDSARLLIDRGARSSSALFAAARFGSVGMVRLLLDHGADPFERYGSEDATFAGFAAIDFARHEYEFKDESARQRVRYVLHELAAGPPPRSREPAAALAKDAREDLERYAAPAERLAFAARFGLYDSVRELLERSAAFAPADLRRATRAALEGRNPDVARLLLESGAPPDGGALHAAAQTNLAGIVKHLLALGADVNERANGATPLESWLVSKERDYEAIRLLLASGADICEAAATPGTDAWPIGLISQAPADCRPRRPTNAPASADAQTICSKAGGAPRVLRPHRRSVVRMRRH
jgi:hypothetical protein